MKHTNIVATIARVTKIIPNLSRKDSYLAYVPLAHVLELVAEVQTLRKLCLCFSFFLTYS
jgi:long-chain acyl-CoA synthetase